jgi:tetratricopeptide (TPR) repeat protein
LEIYKKVYATSPNHPSIAMVYHNLGTAYGAKGEYDKAIGQYNKALDIRLEAYASASDDYELLLAGALSVQQEYTE